MGYWFTVIGAVFYGCLEALLGLGVTGESQEFAKGLVTVIALILTGIGVIKTLILGEGLKGKLIGLATHAVIWIVVVFGMSIIVPIVIVFGVVFIVDRFFLGGVIYAFIHDRFFAGGNDGDDWPMMLHGLDGSTWIFQYSTGDKGYYKNDSTNQTLTVDVSDFEEDYVNTVVGALRWK